MISTKDRARLDAITDVDEQLLKDPEFWDAPTITELERTFHLVARALTYHRVKGVPDAEASSYYKAYAYYAANYMIARRNSGWQPG